MVFFEVILESNCRKLPAAQFLGFAKGTNSFFIYFSSFKFSKSLLLIKTSPLTSNNSGIFFLLIKMEYP